AVGLLTARERAHAAARAEEVVDVLAAELVVAEGVLPRLQREILGGHEGQHRAGPLADRAVARERGLLEVERDLVAHLPAVTAPRVVGFGHARIISQARSPSTLDK